MTPEIYAEIARQADELAEAMMREMAKGRDPIEKEGLYPLLISALVEHRLRSGAW